MTTQKQNPVEAELSTPKLLKFDEITRIHLACRERGDNTSNEARMAAELRYLRNGIFNDKREEFIQNLLNPDILKIAKENGYV